jgi:dUTP pyrophosphatase
MINDVIIKVLREKDIPMPKYSSKDAAGVDISAAEDLLMEPGSSALVPTGLWLAIPPGYEAQLRPRSGLALKHGITVLNSPGTVDSDYRGEIGVILMNHGKSTFKVSKGDRIAQMVISPVRQCRFEDCDDLPPSERGEGGFGSTGLNNEG